MLDAEQLQWEYDDPMYKSRSEVKLNDKFELDAKFHHSPMTTSYENYVHNIFRPGNVLPILPAAENRSVSAYSMLRVQDMLGSAALDDSMDEDIMKAPLEKMFSEQGLFGISDHSKYSSNNHSGSNHYRYPPSRYYPTSSATSSLSHLSSPFEHKDNYISHRKKADEHWKRNNRQMLINHKKPDPGFDSAPISPFMYRDHPYVQTQDSRIVCSNFVQITSRPKDNFIEKINRTLAEVRAMPRY